MIKDFNIPLVISNIGAPQLIKQKKKKPLNISAGKAALEMIGGDVLAIHMNFVQEIVQPEGDTAASGCLSKIKEFASKLPIIAKETGAGISKEVAKALKDENYAVDYQRYDDGNAASSFSALIERTIDRHDVSEIVLTEPGEHRLAAQVAAEALDRGDVTAQGLSVYQQRAEQAMGKQLARSYRLREAFAPEDRSSRRFLRLFAVATGNK